MPITTTRLALPYPVLSDPADVPGDMGNLATALDGGSNVNWDGAAVIISTPGVVGSLPSNPVVGTIYPVNSTPPYLLYYTGESVPGNANAPTGWRLVGGVGTNTANITASGPGNSVQAGSQPVWAALDHQHATPAWGVTAQVSTSTPGNSASGGSVAAYARVDHGHAVPYAYGQAHQTGNQSVATNTTTPVNLTQAFVGGNITFNSGADAFQVALAGAYWVSGSLNWGANSNPGLWAGYGTYNGTQVQALSTSVTLTPTYGLTVTFSGLLKCSIGDHIGLGCYQSIGGPATLYASQTALSVQWVGP